MKFKKVLLAEAGSKEYKKEVKNLIIELKRIRNITSKSSYEDIMLIDQKVEDMIKDLG